MADTVTDVMRVCEKAVCVAALPQKWQWKTRA
jgi:hypothetical protein